MLLSELAMASGLRFEGEDTDIVSIEYDSRRVKKGSLFCCIVGSLFDGHTFAEGAIQNGATALLVERELPLPVPHLFYSHRSSLHIHDFEAHLPLL